MANQRVNVGLIAIIGAIAAVLVVGIIVVLGNRHGNQGDGNPFGSDGFDIVGTSPSARCETELDTVKTAIAAWNTQWAAGDPADIFDTTYPTSMADLTDPDGGPLERPASGYDISGDGDTYPEIIGLGGCPSP
jgi:hypothetical protein